MNCKQGDLAVVVSDAFEENVGAFVTVICYEPDPWGPFSDEIGWACKSSGPLKCIDATTGRISVSLAGSVVLFQDSNLRPIRPRREPEQITRELEAV